MNSALPKQFHLLRNQPVLFHTIKSFIQAVPEIHIVAVIPPEHRERVDEIMGMFPEIEAYTTTSGGATRFESVKNGLRIIPDNAMVLVHDGVRCLVQPALIINCLETASRLGNAVPAIPATDSVRITSEDGNRQVDRATVRLIQTPQTFQSTLLKACYNQQYSDNFTDDASVIEAAGHRINLVNGDATNIKITWPIDLVVAEEILKSRS